VLLIQLLDVEGHLAGAPEYKRWTSTHTSDQIGSSEGHSFDGLHTVQLTDGKWAKLKDNQETL